MMNTWCPLYSQLPDSSLWEEPLEVRVLFMTMLSIKDADHTVNMPFRRLVKKANMPVELVRSALDVLLAPDTKSDEPQEFEGRRLAVIEGGWLVLNGEKYQKEMSKVMRRLRKTQWQREARARAKEQVSAEYMERERRAVKAAGEGDQVKADEIAAEGIT